MNTNALANMETFYTALADKTRLRLLNLMRDEEVCVCFFTEVLGESQPKISRHLAYLRNAGLVKARRDGKWMHYSIIEPENIGGKKVLKSVLEWLEDQQELRSERERYRTVCCTPELLVQIARTPISFLSEAAEPDTPPEPKAHTEPEDSYSGSRHNEMEEYLL